MQHNTNTLPDNQDTKALPAPPAWLAKKIDVIRSRSRGGVVTMKFSDPLVGAGFHLLLRGEATCRTDHERGVHILTFVGEGK